MTLRDQLQRDEGIRRFAYRDSRGILTVGVGRNLEHVGLRPDEIDYLLDNDIAHVEQEVSIALPWTDALDEVRRAVLQNMCFNMGLRTLLTFRAMLSACEAGNWQTTAVEMLDSTWATQVGDRAVRLARQMETGEWQ